MTTKVFDNFTRYRYDSKVLFLDYEVSPTLGWAYKKWEANLIAIEEDWYIQAMSWSWGNQEEVHCLTLPDFRGYKRHPHDDLELVKKALELLNEAEIVVAHNGDRFDVKVIMTRILIHGLSPPRPFRTIDTLKVARKYFKFIGNSLDELARIAKIEGKSEVRHGDLWRKCHNGDLHAWKLMKAYCKQDSKILKEVYRWMLPFVNPFPVLRPFNGKCRKCSGTNFQKRGYHYTASGVLRHKMMCITCHSWCLSDPD